MQYAKAVTQSFSAKELNILIVSPYYFPNINPRPYRWTKIAEFLADEGHKVTIVTEKQVGYPEKETRNGVLLRRTGHAALKSVFFKSKRGVVGKGGTRHLEKLAKWVNQGIFKRIYFPDDSFIWYFSALKEAQKVIDEGATDVVISSSLPFTSHLIGLNLKKKYPNLLWIADCGDPFAFQTEAPLNNHFFYNRLNHYFEKQVLIMADRITVTSELTKEKYADFYPEMSPKFHVIPPILTENENPGYSGDEFQLPELGIGKIRLGYFGKFYEKIRMPEQLTGFLDALFGAEPEIAALVEVHVFGDIFHQFFPELKKYPQIKVHGLIPREHVSEVMNKMDLLVNISNITDYQLPSKAPDYLFSGKAILNIFSNEADEFKRFFAQYPAIFNYRLGATINDKLIDFIENACNVKVNPEWIEEEIKRYRVDAIAGAYQELFKEIHN